MRGQLWWRWRRPERPSLSISLGETMCRTPRSASAPVFAALALTLLVGTSRADLGADPWWIAYQRGIAALEAGDAAAAVEELEIALEKRPGEALSLRVADVVEIDYLPSLYLAVAYAELGNMTVAQRYLRRVDEVGLAGGSTESRELLAKYRSRIEAGASGSELGPASSFRRFTAGAPSLTDRRAGAIYAKVLRECGLDEAIHDDRLPWYFYFELGLELERAGDAERALEAYIAAVDRAPEPQGHAHLYGLWYRRYFPYQRIAELHASLGRPECAADALAYSRDLEFPKMNASEIAKTLELEEELSGASTPKRGPDG